MKSSQKLLYLTKTVRDNATLLYAVKSYIYIFSFSMTQQPLVGQSILIIEASRSHSVTQITLGRTSVDEWSARRRGLYLTTHNSHKRQTSMPPAVLKLLIPASQRPQNHNLDLAATRISILTAYFLQSIGRHNKKNCNCLLMNCEWPSTLFWWNI
jgi:hypothetical protein